METALLSQELDYNTLLNKLKDVLSGEIREIRDEIKRETQDFIVEYIESNEDKSSSKHDLENYDHRDLILHMQKEIEFLRGELSLKNQIIQNIAKFSQKPLLHDEQVFSHTENTNIFKKNEKNRENPIIDREKLSQKGDKNNKTPDNKNNNTNVIDRKNVFIVGDSLLNGINENGMKKLNHNVKVRNHPGATTEDIIDHIKPILRKKPDLLIVHSGTNDLNNEKVNTTECLENINRYIKKTSPNTTLVVSKLIKRKDKPGIEKNLNDLNESIERSCKLMNVEMIGNDNIMEGNLSTKKLHLNKSGNSKFAQNLIKFIREFK